METKEKIEVPSFKLAKVGGDRRRKSAGLLGLLGMSGGSGAASAVGTSMGIAAKAVMMSLITSIGIGAYNVGKGLAPADAEYRAKKKGKKAFQQYQYKADETAALPKDAKYAGSSGLAMVSGSLDGKTPEQRAAEAAEAERKAQEEAAAAAKEQAEAEKEPETVAGAPADAAMDPAALMAAAAGKGEKDGKDGKGMDKKFGQLSNNLGGGGSRLAGGSGMAGGMTKSFEAPKFKNPNTGKALAFSSGRPNASRAASKPMQVGSNSRGFARRQLDKSFQYSRAASKASDETASQLADQAFNNNPGQGNIITGAGSGAGRAAVGASDSANPGSQPSYGGSGAGMAYDDCDALFPDGGFISSPQGGCVKDPKGTGEDDPTNNYVKILKYLLIAGTIAGLIQLMAIMMIKKWTTAVIALAASAVTPVGAAALAAAKLKLAFWANVYNMMKTALTAIGVGICAMGLMIMGMGRQTEGGIFAAVGALMAIIAQKGSPGTDKAAEEAAKEAGKQATEAAAKEATKEAIKQTTQEAVKNVSTKLVEQGTSHLSSGLAQGINVGLSGGGTGYAYSDNLDPRTLNPETGRWEG